MSSELLVKTTFLHLGTLAVVCPLTLKSGLYSLLVSSSTTASIFWHLKNEPHDWSFWLDYGLAGAWTLVDIGLAYEKDVLRDVLLLQAIAIVTNKIVERSSNYNLYHSLWHILSACKCIAVAAMLFRSKSP
jgi:hypothetical protein